MEEASEKFKRLLSAANNNLLTLLTNAAEDAGLREQCCDRQFAHAWSQHHSFLREKAEQPALFPYDQLAPFFQCALTLVVEKKQYNTAKKYCEILANPPYNNFYALKKLTENSIKLLGDNKENTREEKIMLANKATTYAKIAAQHHFTKGHLLWTFVHFESAKVFRQDNSPLATSHLEMAYQQVLIAERLNEYWPVKENLKELFGFESISDIKTKLLQFIHDSGLSIVSKRAEDSAKEDVMDIIKLYAADKKPQAMEIETKEPMGKLCLF